MFYWLSSHESKFYALLRIASGFVFIFHGTQKLFGFPSPMPFDAPPLITYVAGPIEFVGGVLIMIGFMTRPAAFLCSGLMAAAYWMGHGTKALLPIDNGGDLAFVLCFLYLFIAAHGSGPFSVDASRGEV